MQYLIFITDEDLLQDNPFTNGLVMPGETKDQMLIRIARERTSALENQAG
jgi:hypothetical protein